MNTSFGNIQKRLARLECSQRAAEFKKLSQLLMTREQLTPQERAALMARVLVWFKAQVSAGIPLLTSIRMLPDPFRSELCHALLADPNCSPADGAMPRQQEPLPATSAKNVNQPQPPGN